MSGVVVSLCDHCLPQATAHRVCTTFSGPMGPQVLSPDLFTSLPPSILPENSENVSTRRRFPAQSYSSCPLTDNIKWPITVRVVLKSNSTHIFTISSFRLIVSGLTYTVTSPCSLPATFTHSAYAATQLDNRSAMSDMKDRK